MGQLLACNSAAPIMVNHRLLGSAIRMSEIIKVLDTAAEIAKKMSHHEHADITVASFRQRWHNTHNISK